jgi:hypothetical protein
MKKTLFIFMALLFVGSKAMHAQGLDCKPLRNGTFKIVQYRKTTIIKRYGSSQLEYADNSTVPNASYIVKWKNGCTYTLTPTRAMLKQHPEVKKNMVLTVETFLKNTDSYTQVVSSNYSRAKTNVNVYKIK